MECAIRTIRKINFNMGAIKVEDTKRIRFSNMAKFMFNEDQAIIFNRLNGQWIKFQNSVTIFWNCVIRKDCRGVPCLKVLLMTRIENI